MKQTYLDAQTKILESIPMNPFELTEAGIKSLRRNVLLSIASLAFCMFMSLITFRWSATGTADITREGLPMMFAQLGGLLFLLFGSLWVMSKSTDALLATGLYWRISVSDELQDEWELAQKRKSYAKAFEYVVYGLALLFIAVLAFCGLYRLIAGSLPAAPGFGVTAITAGLLIYVIALAPLIHLAWTLDPIEDEALPSGEVMTRKPKRETPLTPKEKRLKRLWSWGPVVLGGVIGIVWASTQ
jgi:hypothetical protein